MTVVADTCVILDFLDGVIGDPFELIRPYRMIFISPVAYHEMLRTYPVEAHVHLGKTFKNELLPPPSVEHWTESAQILRRLYSRRREANIARMQNDVLIALAARDLGAPVWSRDSDFKHICNNMGVGLIEI